MEQEKRVWREKRVSEQTRDKLLDLLKKRKFSLFIKTYEEGEPLARANPPHFKFRDIVSHNLGVLQERYLLQGKVNASLIEAPSRNFIAMEYPTTQCFEGAAELVEKTRARVIVSLIGNGRQWQDDFLRSAYTMVEETSAHSFLSLFAPERERGPLEETREELRVEVHIQKGRGLEQRGMKELLGREGVLVRINCNTWADKTPPSLLLLENLHCTYLSIISLFSDPASLHTPTIVHCLAGAGRTGTFIFYTMLSAVRADLPVSEEAFVDLFLYLRAKRSHMVETASQLEFLHGVFL
jgi:protein tyrosine phosphatase